jgi:hypothetical protein
MTAHVVGIEWIKGEMPTMADADYNCSLWVSGIAENTGNRMVGMMPYAKAVEALKSGMCDSWADTGLKLPEPPDFGDD